MLSILESDASYCSSCDLCVSCVAGLNLFYMCLQKRFIMSESVSENDTGCDAEDVPAAAAVETSLEFTSSSAVTSMDDGGNGSDSDESETEDEDESDEEESGSSDEGDDDGDDDDDGAEEDEDVDSDSGNNTYWSFYVKPSTHCGSAHCDRLFSCALEIFLLTYLLPMFTSVKKC